MSKLSLSQRFTLILTAVFLVGIVVGGTAHWRALQGRAQEEISTQGTLLIEAMNAIRGYTSANVRPLLKDDLDASREFIPETVPAFSARTVFEKFREQLDFETYLYKEAALNPTSPSDLADEFEAQLLRDMIVGKTEGEVNGYRTLNGAELFYIARPLAIGSESCLECHGDPADAPESLLVTYGDQNGFGWEVGEIVAAQIIYVPAAEVFDAAFRTFTLVMSVFIGIFALITFLINFLLRRYVIQPVDVLSGLAQKISVDENFSADLESATLKTITARPDELGKLAQVFRQMAADVAARARKLRDQVKELTIKIDLLKRDEQVREVVETEFFDDLQKKARSLREERDADEKEDNE